MSQNLTNSCRVSSSDDYSIIQVVLNGDTVAFDEIMKKYKMHVFRIVSGMVQLSDVEDVAHQVFIKAFRSLSSYKRKAPFEHWISKIAVRTCYDHWRIVRREKSISMSNDKIAKLCDIMASSPIYEETTERRISELTESILHNLNPEDRLALTLLYMEELSMKEASEVLGWSIPKLKIRSFRARSTLRKQLQSQWR